MDFLVSGGTRCRFVLSKLGAVMASSMAVVGATAGAAYAVGPGLPRTYDVQRIDAPNPLSGGLFGLGAGNAGDVNGDGEDDLLVPQTPEGAVNPEGRLFVFSGETGERLDTVEAPDSGNPGADNSAADFASPLADRIGLNASSPPSDVGSCPGGTAGRDCATVGPADGVPDILVPAPNVDVGGVVDVGRAYVLDGRTRAVLKRIDPPADQRRAGMRFSARVLTLAGLPACEGNAGVGACPSGGTAGQEPRQVTIGDVDGGGKPDILITAFAYPETPATAMPGSDCARRGLDTVGNPIPGALCRGAGRAYIYRGEDVTGNPSVALAEPLLTIRNPAAQLDDPDNPNRTEFFGQGTAPVGDVGSCAPTAPGTRCAARRGPDGRPDFIVAATRQDLPLNNPDPALTDVGVVFLIDGVSGSILFTYHHPEPQRGANFGFITTHSQPASGDLGGSGLPDVYVPAPRHDAAFIAQGRGYVLSGATNRPFAIDLARLDDPTPVFEGNFGTGSAGVGDLVSGAATPANELLVGAVGPLDIISQKSTSVINDVHFFNPATQQVLQTIPDPDQQGGTGFGESVVPLGDLNEDGFLDFAVGAYLYDSPGEVDQGRMYIFRSNNSPVATAPAPAPPAPAPAPAPAPGGPQPKAGEKLTAKLSIARATINRRLRLLDVLAPITARASGRVDVQLHAAGQRFRFTAPIDSADGRVRFRQRIPAAQARLRTGILTISYAGDSDTRPQTVRLRAANRPANLQLARPQIVNNRVRATGTVSRQARGVVRLQLEYDRGGETQVARFRAAIRNGRWSLNEPLSAADVAGIAQRSGTVHSYVLFTGYQPARMRGEMRSFQVLGDR